MKKGKDKKWMKMSMNRKKERKKCLRENKKKLKDKGLWISKRKKN